MRERLARIALGSVLAFLILTLTGCTGGSETRVDMELKVADDGSIENEVRLKGVVISEGSESALEDQWKVTVTDSNTVLRGKFAGVASYGEAIETASAVLRDEFVAGNRFAPQVDSGFGVELRTTNFLLVKRNVLEVRMPTVETQPDACPECNGVGAETCDACGGDGIVTCSACGGDGVWESYWGNSQCSTCDGTGDVVCDTCDGDGRIECYACGGSGEPSQETLDFFGNASDSTEVELAVAMPGLRPRTQDGDEDLKWTAVGSEALGGEVYSASSWSVNWIVLVPTLLLLAALIALAVILAGRRLKAAARGRAAAAAPVVQVDPAARFCSACGARNDAAAGFCTSCGKSMKAS